MHKLADVIRYTVIIIGNNSLIIQSIESTTSQYNNERPMIRNQNIVRARSNNIDKYLFLLFFRAMAYIQL